jgi:hypothetical protein
MYMDKKAFLESVTGVKSAAALFTELDTQTDEVLDMVAVISAMKEERTEAIRKREEAKKELELAESMILLDMPPHFKNEAQRKAYVTSQTAAQSNVYSEKEADVWNLELQVQKAQEMLNFANTKVATVYKKVELYSALAKYYAQEA